MTESKLRSIVRAMRSRNYRLYFMGQGVSLIGTWMQAVALGWLVYRVTNSTFLLGLVGFINQFPMMLLTPFTGVLADRWNRHRMMVIIQIALMVLSLILAILVLFHWVTIWHIIVLGMLLGAFNAADAPTRHAFVVELVDNREDLSNAIALNSALFNSARLIGPSLAGLVIAWTGEGVCFLLNAVSFLAVIFALLAMKMPSREIEENRVQSTVWNDLKDGFRYTFRSKPIRMILLHFAFVALGAMSFTVLMPVFASQVLKGDSKSFGLLMGAMGIGALLGSLYMASLKDTHKLWKIAAISSTIFGIGLIALSQSRHFLLAFVFMMVTGVGMVTIMTASNTYLQTNIDDDKRSRVMAFYLLAFWGTVPSGNLLFGSVAHNIGVPMTILCAGFLSLIGSWVFMWKYKTYLTKEKKFKNHQNLPGT